MNMKIEELVFIILIVALIFLVPPLHLAYDPTNVSTTVNITNSRPVILNVDIYDGNNINLSEGSTQEVWCNISIREYNGPSDISVVNATLFIQNGSIALGDPDNNNSHYTNTSCASMGGSGNYANYTCTFQVYYYAANGTWNCTAFVNDSVNFNNNNSNTSTIIPLYALNISDIIDYGNLALEEYSENISLNITNYGNMPINLTLYGYGNESGDGLAMVCEQNNISIDNERWSIDPAAVWGGKVILTGTEVQSNMTIQKQTVPGTYIINKTYWQLYTSPATNPFGRCNGTVIINAVET